MRGTWRPDLGAVMFDEDMYVGPQTIDTVKLPEEHGGIHVPVLAVEQRPDGSHIFYLAHKSPNAVISNGIECLWVDTHWGEEE